MQWKTRIHHCAKVVKYMICQKLIKLGDVILKFPYNLVKFHHQLIILVRAFGNQNNVLNEILKRFNNAGWIIKYTIYNGTYFTYCFESFILNYEFVDKLDDSYCYKIYYGFISNKSQLWRSTSCNTMVIKLNPAITRKNIQKPLPATYSMQLNRAHFKLATRHTWKKYKRNISQLSLID